MTTSEIVRLAIDNDLVFEVYGALHNLVMARYGEMEKRTHELNSELRLVKKFADANKFDVIKDILKESDK